MIRLDGCRPSTLSSYMAGMGVFRLTAEQKNPGVRAFWERDRLVLETDLTRDDVIGFLLHEYEPSPVISPWSLGEYRNGVGLAGPIIGLDRMRGYREAVESTERVLRAFRESEGIDGEVTNADIKAAKAKFIRTCRNMWPDGAVEWLDAVAILAHDKPAFSPLFGTGGNDGRFNVSVNFAERLSKVFCGRRDMSRTWLEAALFGGDAELAGLRTFGHDPRGSGRPNSGSGYMGAHVSNPWEHILMVEGMLMFAGGISRRTARQSGWSAFPFVSDATRAGYATAADEKNRGEAWLPLWDMPASYRETLLVLREGRASYGGGNARTGTDFALAAASFGVERGIGRFRRFGMLGRKGGKRKSPMHMPVDLGTVRVRDAPEAGLVDDVRRWHGRMLRFVQNAKNPPHAVKAAVRRLDGSIIDMCREPGPAAARALLAAFGRLERAVSGRTWRDEDRVEPFSGSLSAGWLRAADDGSAEFRLAAAAASVGGGGNSVRRNLEEVKYENDRWVADRGSVSCVWSDGSTLYDNLGRICMRRVMEAKAAGDGAPPLRGTVASDPGDVEEFLAGALDEQKIADLLLPLSMVSMDGQTYDVGRADTAVPVPAAYALLGSVYGTPGVLDMEPLSLLKAGRAAYALESARRRARACGMLDGAGVAIGAPPERAARRLLGSLAFPVRRAERAGLLDAAGLREPPYE